MLFTCKPQTRAAARPASRKIIRRGQKSLAVAKLEYCMTKLGFRGMEIDTKVRGMELSDARFERLFARAEELGAVILLHPIGFTDPSRLTQHFLTNVIGNAAKLLKLKPRKQGR